ncbi:MAG: hypothetical protein ABW168_00340 [Sedimenticola sp.]
MENRVPLPTDNIFKFYSLFGLLLVIFSIGAVIFVSKSTNDLVVEIAVEYKILEADPIRTLSQETRFQILQRQLEVAIKNKHFFLSSLGVVILIGIIMMGYGFRKWHTEIQPLQDEMARLCLKKLQRELGEDESA